MTRPPGEPQDEAIKIPDVLPVLPLKDTVVFPYIILPLSVGRDKSVLAVDRALSESRVIMLVAQRNAMNLPISQVTVTNRLLTRMKINCNVYCHRAPPFVDHKPNRESNNSR